VTRDEMIDAQITVSLGKVRRRYYRFARFWGLALVADLFAWAMTHRAWMAYGSGVFALFFFWCVLALTELRSEKTRARVREEIVAELALKHR
jgi:hypothetical protein